MQFKEFMGIKTRVLSILTGVFILFGSFSIDSLAKGETMNETAIFAGGCFWCLEGPFEAQPGVLDAKVGYTGGSIANPTYSQVSTGRSGHYEAIKLVFDPKVVSYEKLLEIFWRQIDPTQADGQFADIGPQYRSAIFYLSEDQKIKAEKSKKELGDSQKFSKPIATEIKAASEFYAAEEDHQEYYKKAPEHYKRYKYGSGRQPFIEKTWGK